MNRIESVHAMAKKKAQPPKPPDQWQRKPMAIQMRGSDAWREWAERGAAHVGLKLPTVVDQALRLYFRENGFPESPPER